MSFTKADLAISTMWNFRKAHSGEELIDQLRELGFSRVELNYQVRTEWLSGIRRRINEILREELTVAMATVERNRAAMGALIEALVERNRLMGNEIDEILKKTAIR